MAVERSGLRDIIGGDGLVGAPEEDVRRELAADNGDIRGEVHTQHAQHAFSSFSLSRAIVFFFAVITQP